MMKKHKITNMKLLRLSSKSFVLIVVDFIGISRVLKILRRSNFRQHLSDPIISSLSSINSSLVLTSPSQSITLHDSRVKSTGSKQSRPYINSNAEYPIDRRTETRSAHSASGRYFAHSSGFLLQYFDNELTIES